MRITSRRYRKNKARPRIKIKGQTALQRGLFPEEIARFRAGIFGPKPAINEAWRKLIEIKSKFIPKIWGDV